LRNASGRPRSSGSRYYSDSSSFSWFSSCRRGIVSLMRMRREQRGEDRPYGPGERGGEMTAQPLLTGAATNHEIWWSHGGFQNFSFEIMSGETVWHDRPERRQARPPVFKHAHGFLYADPGGRSGSRAREITRWKPHEVCPPRNGPQLSEKPTS